ncbi:Transcriptional regulator, AraC family protein [Minicystis rosea]|nr:Transcriptional regulator, AraC family protein [Minicystis rosea]
MKAAWIALRYAGSRGIDVDRVARSHDLDPAQLTDPFGRVPHAIIVAVWQDLAALTHDPAFGLHAAEASHGQAFDAVDYTLRHCATVGDALDRVCRYQRLMHEGGVVRLDVEGSVARYTQSFHCEPPAPRHFVEFVFAMWVSRLRRSSGGPLPLFEVAFAHAAPADMTEHRRIFAAKLRFGAPENAIVFDAALLAAPLIAADPTLIAVIDRQVEALLEKLPPRDDFLAALRRALADELAHGALELDRIARRMRTSPRTLQRRLREAGITFQAYADEVRRDLTLERLAAPGVSITEIAFLAGFSNVSAFHRAFRRWTGTTPAEHRRRALAGP